MGDKTSIEWTDATWNPIVGCSRVSEGCDHCYAMGVVHRGMSVQHRGLTVATDKGVDWNGKINIAEGTFDKPLRWKRPRRVFVNSLSDLFHPNVEDETIARIFAVMSLAEQHTFQVLTKRPQRMAKLLSSPAFGGQVMALRDDLAEERGVSGLSLHHGWPLPNVHLGVSIESDKFAWRADHLRATPAAVRWISAEPLLGPLPSLDLTGIDWVVAGGESGPGARPMHPDWVRELRDRCVARCDHVGHWEGGEVGVPGGHDGGDETEPCTGPAFLFKQWGDWFPEGERLDEVPKNTALGSRIHLHPDGSQRYAPNQGSVPMRRIGKKAAGRYLDGRTWDEYPEVGR